MPDNDSGAAARSDASAASRTGFMLVLSSPSGAGKTSLAHRLLEVESDLRPSISVTTRPQRANETDGVDYIFVSRDRFEAMREAGELLESAEVFGNMYGTPRAPVEQALKSGCDVLFDIDWQGSAQLRAAAPADVVCTFILPPSAHSLRQRLNNRGLDSPEVIARRLTGAVRELDAWQDYDYIVVNGDFEQSLKELRAIVRAERLRRARRLDIGGLVRQIQNDL